ncbi:MAG: hypothetical protein GY696_20070, partial [Gammaproteobacteria bacterium]|nr:hypothetical protein [Gammaproteobacteria bacterium]
MQTAWTEIRVPDRPVTDFRQYFKVSSVWTRVFLDCASDRSYISKALADKLGLKPMDKEMLRITKLRQLERAESFESPIVELEVRLKDNSYLTVFANVISPVIGRIRRYPVASVKWGSLFPTHKALADTIP